MEIVVVACAVLRWSVYTNTVIVRRDSLYIYHQCVLPKFTANSGRMAAVLPKGRSSEAKSGTKVAVLLGMSRCGRLPLLSAPTLSLAIEHTLKDLKMS